MLVAKIKSGTVPPYLTEGKEYEAHRRPTLGLFSIQDDTGNTILCAEFMCAYLQGGSWDLYEKD